MLEQQQSKLVNGIHELYKRAIENGGWDGEPLPTTSKGYPLTHDILKHLGLLQLSAPEDEDEGFQEDTDILERLARIKEQKVTLEDESARKREQEKAYNNNAPPTPISATKSEFSPIPSPVHGRFGSHQQFKSEYSPAESPAQGLFGSQQHFEEIAQSYFPASQSITPVDPPGYTFTEEIDQLWGNSNPTPPMDQTPMDMAAEFVRAQQNQIWAQSQADRNTQTGCYEQCHPSLHYTIDSITGPLEPSKLDTTLLNSPDPSWSPIFPYEFSMSPRMSTHGG